MQRNIAIDACQNTVEHNALAAWQCFHPVDKKWFCNIKETEEEQSGRKIPKIYWEVK